MPLLIQTAIVQTVALPAVFLAYAFIPACVSAVFAAVVGAHLLPYAWLQKSHLYIVQGLIISFVPYLMAMVLRETSFNYIGFVVGGLRFRRVNLTPTVKIALSIYLDSLVLRVSKAPAA